MHRKDFLQLAGLSLCSTAMPANWWTKLVDDPPVRAEVKVLNGGPRLFINGELTPPFFALSTSMYPTVENFRRAGINILHPIVSLQYGWTGPSQYDWTRIDAFLAELLRRHPQAFFFPRFTLNTPRWWRETHPDELIQYGLEGAADRFDIVRHQGLTQTEGGHYMGSGAELWEASLASRKWLDDTTDALTAYIRHVQTTPLRSRMIGYFIAHGRTSEWNYFGSNLFPDYSAPMVERCGTIPSVRRRIDSDFGLLRDPAREADVMQFYACLHDAVTDNVVHLARAVKEEGPTLPLRYLLWLPDRISANSGCRLSGADEGARLPRHRCNHLPVRLSEHKRRGC